MKKPQFYDEVQGNTGDFVSLQPGAYVCTIKKALFAKAQQSQNDMLVLLLDIAEGECKDYFQNRFDKDERTDKKWGCVLRVVLDDESKSVDERKQMAKNVKSTIESIEASNLGFKFDWDAPEKANGKLVGALFGLEEYTANDGKTKTISKVRRARSVNAVKTKNLQIPAVKLLDKTYMEYDEYLDKKFDSESQATEVKGDFITIESDEELPF